MNFKGLAACLCLLSLFGCNSSRPSKQAVDQQQQYILGFYNVENLFDTRDNPNKIDEDFLPSGRYQWTDEKYQVKLTNIAKAIALMGTKGPDVIGLAEVENEAVLADLVKQAALSPHAYKIVHEESPDMRGIDVALLYDPSAFTYQDHKAYEMNFPAEPDYTSRKVLWVKGQMNGQTIHLLVNHWPSRRGGQEESEPRRTVVAEQVRKIVDEIYTKEKDANVILMGDFNDDPFNKSIVEVMRAKKSPDNIGETELYNATASLHQPADQGTLTYKGKWNLFDQMLLSQDLVNGQNGLQYVKGSTTIHGPEVLQVGGNGRAKDMPRRAIYRGEFQENGYSDHFGVYLTLKSR
ncbi:MAG: endonuclease/exonuclease/phosphatase family protein [Bacteroidota bacterium]